MQIGYLMTLGRLWKNPKINLTYLSGRYSSSAQFFRLRDIDKDMPRSGNSTKANGVTKLFSPNLRRLLHR